jgi:hypothetical protein
MEIRLFKPHDDTSQKVLRNMSEYKDYGNKELEFKNNGDRKLFSP